MSQFPSENTPLVLEGNTDESSQRNCNTRTAVALKRLIAVSAGLCGGYLLGSTHSTQLQATTTTTTTAAATNYRERPSIIDDAFARFDDVVADGNTEDINIKYIGTQLVTFTINTFGGLNKRGECEGRDVSSDGSCYLGSVTNNITEDVYHRLDIVKHVLNRIKEDSLKSDQDIDHDDHVLKIVMLPEFFWRGPHGAYSTREMFNDDGVLVQVSNVIRTLIKDEFFNDFLFVFGTVIAARSPNDPHQPWEHALDGDEVEYYNFASIAKGGPDGKYFAVTKQYVSGVDFLSRTSLPNPSEFHSRNYTQMGENFEKAFARRNTTIVRNNLVELDGLRIGVEICLDHRLGVLWDQLKTKHDGELVDILLITSAGMSIQRGPNPVVPGGVVYLSDGGASSAACIRSNDDSVFDPDTVCRGVVGGLKHIPVGGSGYSNFFGLSACWDVENTSLLEGYFSMYRPQGCAYTLKKYDIDVMDEFKYYPPSIEIYPTVALPAESS